MLRILLLSLSALPLFAQNLTLGGRVLDANRLPIDGASVAYSRAGQRPVYTQTDNEGRYRLEGLAMGAGSVRILKPGFAELRQVVTLGASLTDLDFTLSLAEVSTTVVVEDVAGKTTATRMDVPNLEVPIQVGSVSAQVLEQRG